MLFYGPNNILLCSNILLEFNEKMANTFVNRYRLYNTNIHKTVVNIRS